MPSAIDADSISILVSSDNHVGYNERDAARGEDSWRSFHEVMCLAREKGVDMVLLAGDLFHENKPSRQAMYQVMRSLRMNCYGDKPCELEMLSDASENFGGTFDHVNYEDQDINVAMPVFSIHGNHDDPSGEGHLSALDVLQMSGLVNYYGRTPESDNIQVKPVLLQKGRTKLALYGLSNVRDERLYRTFRDGKVKFFQPSMQKENWFNIISVHQNRPKRGPNDTNHLPANALPDFMDLVIWGHEHECKIDPTYIPNMNFHVMQPGSSVATSLVEGEAVQKQAAILKITGKQFQCETIPLKTVRPFVMKNMVLQDEPGMKSLARKDNNRNDINRHLKGVVRDLIAEAETNWMEAQGDDHEEGLEIPLPLVRLKVEYTAPEGGRYECENPQRFSSWFHGQVANETDVVQFYRKKTSTRRAKDGTEVPDESVLAQLSLDSIKVEKLVREYLTAQSLTILPQNSFGDAVSQFVDKDDKHAMEMFVIENLAQQVDHLLKVEEVEEDDIAEAMETYRAQLEHLFDAGHLKNVRKTNLKPRPEAWDSDLEGPWEDTPGARLISDNGEDQEDGSNVGPVPPKAPATRGRGRGRGAKTASTSRTNASASKRGSGANTSSAGRGGRSKKPVSDEEDEEEDNVIMLDDDDEEEEPRARKAPQSMATVPRARVAAPAKKPPPRASDSRQSQLNFSQPLSQYRHAKANKPVPQELSDDEISDDEDAFEPTPRLRTGR